MGVELRTDSADLKIELTDVAIFGQIFTKVFDKFFICCFIVAIWLTFVYLGWFNFEKLAWLLIFCSLERL